MFLLSPPTPHPKTRGVDYNTEIPFQKRAPAGFFDTSGEDAVAEAAAGADADAFKAKLKSKLDAPNRDVAEEKARKADAEKLKRRRQETPPGAAAALSILNNPQAIRKRAKLMLPPPQMGDRELERVVKASAGAAAALDDGSEATLALTSSYDQTASSALAATMRTPRNAATSADAVLNEAVAQASMIAANTPLLGGEISTLHLSLGFGSITPNVSTRESVTTPNPLATPMGSWAKPAGGAGDRGLGGGSAPPHSLFLRSTPSRALDTVGLPLACATPSRDALGINELDAPSKDFVPLLADIERRLLKERRSVLAEQFASLPAPSNEYKLVMPELAAPGESEEGPENQELKDKDAHGAGEREAYEDAAAAEVEFNVRSSVIQRPELPRPLIVNPELAAADACEVTAVYEECEEDLMLMAADKMLREEMVKMLEADACTHPLKTGPQPRQRKLKPLLEETLAQARHLLGAEIKMLTQSDGQPPPRAEKEAVWVAATAKWAYMPLRQRYCELSTVSAQEQLQAPQQQLQLLRTLIVKDGKRAAKLESKIEVLLGGYRKRETVLSKQLRMTHTELESRRAELGCFEALRHREVLAVPQRLGELLALIGQQRACEIKLQARYDELCRTRAMLEHNSRKSCSSAA